MEQEIDDDPEPPAQGQEQTPRYEVAEPDISLRAERGDRRGLRNIDHGLASDARGIGVAVPAGAPEPREVDPAKTGRRTTRMIVGNPPGVSGRGARRSAVSSLEAGASHAALR